MRRKFICNVSNGKISKKKIFQKEEDSDTLIIKASSEYEANEIMNNFIKEEIINYMPNARIFSFDTKNSIFECGIVDGFTYKYKYKLSLYDFFKILNGMQDDFLWLKDQYSITYFINKHLLSNGTITISEFQKNISINIDTPYSLVLPLDPFNFDAILKFDKEYAFKIIKGLEKSVKTINELRDLLLRIFSEDERLEYELRRGDIE